ncbi:MAG: 50S ribosomal protein L17 [Candidatus Cloacimonetes bacterium]|jgi:large subunit ribosomal protein L17|nr:50S ribosomal protein L17 [Candidatus Cloacimonadota bacterium]MBT6993539.1 50S ribosomal protein L17 [Candidatus Cloacimonadota bacterium]MBT7468903.1 50S ribosomal protein L17 [Candidatus Cloacimonadota bacterium]
MRHRVKGRKFGLEKGHRNLMMKNLVSSLVIHGRINTTQARAKEMRGMAERVITYGKKGSVHARNLAFKYLQDRTLVKKVFDEIAPRYKDVEGGYTRIMKNGYRTGDRAPMAIIEFVEHSPKKED